MLELSNADQTDVIFLGDTNALTRFANNYIHQNVAEVNTQLTVRMVTDKKIGIASTNDLSDDGLRRVVENAALVTRFQLENPDFVSLPTPEEAGKPRGTAGFVEATASATPELRAEGARAICSLAEEKGLNGSGSFQPR